MKFHASKVIKLYASSSGVSDSKLNVLWQHWYSMFTPTGLITNILPICTYFAKKEQLLKIYKMFVSVLHSWREF